MDDSLDHSGSAVNRRRAAWPYSRGWGYGPSGIVGLLLVILLAMLLLHVIPWGYG